MSKQQKTEVQSLILSKDKFKSEEAARNWAKDHNFKTSKLDETEDSFRFRQFDPSKCQSNSFRTIELDEGVNAVICRPKGQSSICSVVIKNRVNDRRLIRRLTSVLKRNASNRAELSGSGRQGGTSHPKGTVVIDVEELALLRRELLLGFKSFEIVSSKIKKLLQTK